MVPSRSRGLPPESACLLFGKAYLLFIVVVSFFRAAERVGLALGRGPISASTCLLVKFIFLLPKFIRAPASVAGRRRPR